MHYIYQKLLKEAKCLDFVIKLFPNNVAVFSALANRPFLKDWENFSPFKIACTRLNRASLNSPIFLWCTRHSVFKVYSHTSLFKELFKEGYFYHNFHRKCALNQPFLLPLILLIGTSSPFNSDFLLKSSFRHNQYCLPLQEARVSYHPYWQ